MPEVKYENTSRISGLLVAEKPFALKEGGQARRLKIQIPAPEDSNAKFRFLAVNSSNKKWRIGQPITVDCVVSCFWKDDGKGDFFVDTRIWEVV